MQALFGDRHQQRVQSGERKQTEFMNRAARLKRVDAITFHSNLEALVAGAARCSSSSISRMRVMAPS